MRQHFKQPREKERVRVREIHRQIKIKEGLRTSNETLFHSDNDNDVSEDPWRWSTRSTTSCLHKVRGVPDTFSQRFSPWWSARWHSRRFRCKPFQSNVSPPGRQMAEWSAQKRKIVRSGRVEKANLAGDMKRWSEKQIRKISALWNELQFKRLSWKHWK